MLLWAWFALGSDHVDDPLDLVVAVAWWLAVAAVVGGIVCGRDIARRFELEDGTKHKHHTGDEDAMNEVETVLEDGTVV